MQFSGNNSLRPSISVDEMADLLYTWLPSATGIDIPKTIVYDISYFAVSSHFCGVSHNLTIHEGGFLVGMKPKEDHVENGYWGFACLGVPFPRGGGCAAIKLESCASAMTVGVIRTSGLDYDSVHDSLKEHQNRTYNDGYIGGGPNGWEYDPDGDLAHNWNWNSNRRNQGFQDGDTLEVFWSSQRNVICYKLNGKKQLNSFPNVAPNEEFPIVTLCIGISHKVGMDSPISPELRFISLEPLPEDFDLEAKQWGNPVHLHNHFSF